MTLKTLSGKLFIAVLVAFYVCLNIKIILQQSNDKQQANDRIKQLENEIFSCGQHYIQNMKQPAVPVSAFTQSVSDVLPQWKKLDDDKVKTIGKIRNKKGFLTIAIPSIQRANGLKYLKDTIATLIEKMTNNEKEEVVIVVLLGDFDKQYNEKAIVILSNLFKNDLSNGLLRIVQAPRSFYPELVNLKRNFRDPAKRVQWRSKQVIDFSFMFLYSRNISEYYVQLEDDVLPADGYVSHIRDFVKKNSNRQWAMLEFSELGFIGKLVRSIDLEKLARYMMTFYDEQPIDWLIRYFKDSMAQHKVILRKPTLFQHMGLVSSLDNKKPNRLKDRFFPGSVGSNVKEAPAPVQLKGDNPSASLHTSLETYIHHELNHMYAMSTDFFWAKTPKINDTITVVFLDSLRLKRAAVLTGTPEHAGDILREGVLEAAFEKTNLPADERDESVTCKSWREIGKFQNGEVDVKELDKSLKESVYCLRVRITGTQQNWIIFRELAVFINK
ncbi:DgyrCDS4628 [Dimorphilus gyrociliatus]|uniref:DgyrCDS4628 n=1 Tax=Dimorphilus gyrociliatus TaxID=2664684 RepID=A0A7I8VJ00_9ANNE|nr:DgyrCDS4628 [Dimorphilus gyrociliatus]